MHKDKRPVRLLEEKERLLFGESEVPSKFQYRTELEEYQKPEINDQEKKMQPHEELNEFYDI